MVGTIRTPGIEPMHTGAVLPQGSSEQEVRPVLASPGLAETDARKQIPPEAQGRPGGKRKLRKRGWRDIAGCRGRGKSL